MGWSGKDCKTGWREICQVVLSMTVSSSIVVVIVVCSYSSSDDIMFVAIIVLRMIVIGIIIVVIHIISLCLYGFYSITDVLLRCVCWGSGFFAGF